MLVCGFAAEGERSEAYKRCSNGNHATLIARLHNRSIHTLDRIRQSVEITRHELVSREVLVQYVKKVHQARRDIFGGRKVWGKRQLAPQVP